MDYVATDFSLHQTGVVAPSTGHTQAVAYGSFPQQQTPSFAEQNSGSSSHVYVAPLHIMETSTLAIVALFNTQQVILLKLANNNYLY